MPVITIARQLGAGGKTIGETVAQNLGYRFVSNEIIQMVAETAKVSTEMIEALEKDTSGKLSKFFSGLVPKTFADRVREHDSGVLNEEIYADLLRRIIKQIAENDNAVILGRGGQFILADDPNAYHVLLIADDSYRKKFLAQKYNLSYDQATEAMQVEDKRRDNLYRKLNRDDYDNWNNYHMIINMSLTGQEAAINQICTLVTS